MTVAEYIEHLKKLPRDMDAYQVWEGTYHERSRLPTVDTITRHEVYGMDGWYLASDWTEDAESREEFPELDRKQVVRV